MDYQVQTNSREETVAAGTALGQVLQAGDVLAFHGDLGAGKTAFISGVAAGMGCRDIVSSPTYTLVHEYAARVPLFHFDMYRIQSWDDLYSIGFYDYLDRGGVLAIEWSEHIAAALPEQHITVHMHILNETQRKIELHGVPRIEDFSN